MNKIILITGVSSGIGQSLKDRFIANGDTVIGLSRTIIEGENNFKADISNNAQLKEVFDKIENKYKKIDILINNAGYGISGATELISDEESRKIFDVNFFGLLNVTKLALPLMDKHAKIVNISSVLALFPVPYRTLYCTSKCAVTMLSECLKMELSQAKIEVTNICPGDIKSNFTKNRIKHMETNEKYGNSINASTNMLDAHEDKRMPLEYAVTKMYRIIDKKHYKPMYIIGKKYKIAYFFSKIMSKSIFQTLIRKGFLKNK